jgi:hypothetical protein
MLHEETGVRPAPERTHDQLAGDLLEQLGFPSLPPVHGLLHAKRRLLQFRARADHADMAQLRSDLIDAVSDFNSLLKLLLRFVCKWVLDATPDALIQERGWLQLPQALQRCSMGTLVELCSHVHREIHTSKSDRVMQIRRDMPDRPFLPPASDRLANPRNVVLHPERAQSEPTDEQVRQKARAFLDGALPVITYLEEPGVRVFPYVVRIERIVIDRFGRRVIEATSDGEPNRELERIFTAAELHPGEIYLMRPLSNPLRVDPILVAAGDLSRQE